MEEEKISADSCTETAENVSQELSKLYVDTEHVGTLIVAAYSIEVASELCPSEHAEQKDDHYECDYNTDFNVCRNEYAFFVYRTQERDLNFILT